MLADTSDIRARSVAHHRSADDLTAVAADLVAMQVSPDAFGHVGADFLTTLNDALRQEAEHAEHLAECLANAADATKSVAAAYVATELGSGQAISTFGT